MNPLVDLSNILEMIKTDPARAAERLEDIATRLTGLANKLKEIAKDREGIRSTGGVGDRVQIELVGPDGQIKQRIDTGEIK